MPTGFNEKKVDTGRKYILGIGIDAYLNKEWPRLSNAVRDLDNIRSVLEERYKFDGITVIKDAEATRERIEEELFRFTDTAVLGPDDSLLIYYSGHGYLDANNKGYWVPVAAKKGQIASYLPNSRIREIISDMKAKHVLLISDSCYSGSLFADTRAGDDDNSLAATDLERRASRWAFCSGREDEKVSDGNDGNSPFAKALIQELSLNETGKLPIDNIALRVRNITRNNYKQLPRCGPLQDTGDMGGQFVFTLKNYVPGEAEPTSEPTHSTRGGDSAHHTEPTHNTTSVTKPTTRKQLSDAIKLLLADDQVAEGIKLIIDFNDPSLSKTRDTAILLSGRWKALEREDIQGSIDSRDLKSGRAKISAALLSLVGDIYKPTSANDLNLLKQELRELVARAQTDEAIRRLMALDIPELSTDTKTDILGISATYEKLKKDELRGIIDSRDADKTRNTINFKVLDVISSL